MQIHQLTTASDLAVYDAWVRAHPDGTLWQSLAWKKFQEAMGREVRIYAVESARPDAVGRAEVGKCESGDFMATALVVIDKTIGGFSTWEIPRGPLVSEKCTKKNEKCEEFLKTIIEDAGKDRCIQLLASPSHNFSFFIFHFQLSKRHVHPEATRIIDLTQSPEAILAQMHQKGRYNIKVALREGVSVRKGSVNDMEAFYGLLEDTGSRDGFVISQKSHYARFLESLEGSFILMAEHDKKPIAGIMGVVWNGTGIYYYGASSYASRNLMAPYLLQWEALRLCKAAGCTRYDLLGVSPEPAPAGDPWLGISDFKRKFGGTLVTYPPEQELVMRPLVRAALGLKRQFLG